MRLTLLGTGNAAGVPVYGCDCPACNRARIDTTMRRGPCCALIEVDKQRYLIDAGLMDLCERFPATSLDGIVLTHFHVDHVQGLFHLRWGKGLDMPVYCPSDTHGCADLYKHPGLLRFIRLRKFETIVLGDLTITPLPLIHSRPTLGYLFEHRQHRLAYLTDTAGLPNKTRLWLERYQPDILVIDATYPPTDLPPKNHNDLNLALGIHEMVGPSLTVLTHIGDAMDCWLMQYPDALPDAVISAHDGMVITP